MVLERAATPGADNADIRALALQVVQSLSSNGSNIGTLQSGEVAARLKGLRQHMSDDVAVGRAVDAILRSISTISTLLELQARVRARVRVELGLGLGLGRCSSCRLGLG